MVVLNHNPFFLPAWKNSNGQTTLEPDYQCQ